MHLTAAGSEPNRTGTIAIGDVSSRRLGRRQRIAGIGRLHINTFAGDDHLLVDDTVVLTLVDMGSGDDDIVVGTVPMIPDTGNRTWNTRTACRSRITARI